MSGKEQVNIQLFRRWDMSDIEINDPGLKSVINLKPAVIPVTFGRHEHQRLKKAEVNIVEAKGMQRTPAEWVARRQRCST
jgi:small subunit ribosomal protein S7